MARRKTLSEADRRIWNAVARSITRAPDAPRAAPPHDPARVSAAPPPPGAEAPAQPPAHGRALSAPDARPLGPALRTLRPEGPRASGWRVEHAPEVIDGLDPARGLDGRRADRVRRGKQAPEARIDLHGMTADKAHSALAGFIRRSHAQGLRFVLVITGKGGRRRGPEDADWVPEGKGVLRHAAPRWLKQPPLDRLVTGVYSAHIRHGGEGALYVQLSKKR